jgi:hypothetical protein
MWRGDACDALVLFVTVTSRSGGRRKRPLPTQPHPRPYRIGARLFSSFPQGCRYCYDTGVKNRGEGLLRRACQPKQKKIICREDKHKAPTHPHIRPLSLQDAGDGGGCFQSLPYSVVKHYQDDKQDGACPRPGHSCILTFVIRKRENAQVLIAG